MIDILILAAAALGLIGIVYSVMNQRDINKREAEALRIRIEQNRKNINTGIQTFNNRIETKKEEYEKYKNNVYELIDKRNRESKPDSK